MTNNTLLTVQLTEKKLDFKELKPQTAFFVGGSRSGKSDFALAYAETFTGKKAFIATMQKNYSNDDTIITDNELTERIAKHQAQRKKNWITIEEPIYLEQAINKAIQEQSEVILLDCITLWISNLLLLNKEEKEIINIIEQFVQNIKHCPIPLLIVSNEVGMGIVPINKNARIFKDIQGKANQILAKFCQTVLLFSCGIPLLIKNEVK